MALDAGLLCAAVLREMSPSMLGESAGQHRRGVCGTLPMFFFFSISVRRVMACVVEWLMLTEILPSQIFAA